MSKSELEQLIEAAYRWVDTHSVADCPGYEYHPGDDAMDADKELFRAVKAYRNKQDV